MAVSHTECSRTSVKLIGPLLVAQYGSGHLRPSDWEATATPTSFPVLACLSLWCETPLLSQLWLNPCILLLGTWMLSVWPFWPEEPQTSACYFSPTRKKINLPFSSPSFSHQPTNSTLFFSLFQKSPQIHKNKNQSKQTKEPMWQNKAKWNRTCTAKPWSLFSVGQLFLGMECAWYTQRHSTEENEFVFATVINSK